MVRIPNNVEVIMKSVSIMLEGYQRAIAYTDIQNVTFNDNWVILVRDEDEDDIIYYNKTFVKYLNVFEEEEDGS